MLETMNELDETWAQKLDQAITAAEQNGRREVAAYLNLKAANDAVRQIGVQWLFGTLLEIAGRHPNVKIENEAVHRFDFAQAQMVGSLLRLRLGVRCLTLEAGWTRTPNDGFMRGGALAAARLTHFGMAQKNADLILLRPHETPQWFAVDEDRRREFNTEQIERHFQNFIS